MNQDSKDVINWVRERIKQQNHGYERFFEDSKETDRREPRRDLVSVRHLDSPSLHELDSIIVACAGQVRQWAAKYIVETLDREVERAQTRLDKALHGVCDSKLREMEQRVMKELQGQLDVRMDEYVRATIGRVFNQLKYPDEVQGV